MNNALGYEQYFDNSRLADSSVAEDYAAEPKQFFNSKDPNLAILHEKPEHRMVILLKAMGKSNNEIAERTGFTFPWVSQILRQPWARQRLLEEITKAGKDEMQELLKGASADSVHKLIKLRDSADSEQVQFAAASNLLDRFLGKPKQQIETTNKHTIVSGDIEAVNNELRQLEEEEKRLLGKTTTVDSSAQAEGRVDDCASASRREAADAT